MTFNARSLVRAKWVLEHFGQHGIAMMASCKLSFENPKGIESSEIYQTLLNSAIVTLRGNALRINTCEAVRADHKGAGRSKFVPPNTLLARMLVAVIA
jgi:hypothetical protein